MIHNMVRFVLTWLFVMLWAMLRGGSRKGW